MLHTNGRRSPAEVKHDATNHASVVGRRLGELVCAISARTCRCESEGDTMRLSTRHCSHPRELAYNRGAESTKGRDQLHEKIRQGDVKSNASSTPLGIAHVRDCESL